MKRLFITISFIVLSTVNAAAQTFERGDFTYCKLYGTYNEVSIKGSTDKTALTIPSTVDYEGVTYSITGIEYDAFLSHNNLQTISIPNSVQYIWGTPFSGCENLQYIEYDNALYLGNDENKYLWLIKAKSKGITSCGINNNCKHIAENAFDGCDKLTAIVIPNSVVDIGHYAFNNCSGLSSVTIPISVITIGTQAFNCDNTIFVCEAQSKPQGWGDYTSYYCSGTWNNCQGTTYWGLSFIVGDFAYSIIGDNTVSVRKYLGNGLDVSIPSVVTFNGNEYKVTDIGEAVFQNKDLTEITIPETVKNIGKEAFYGCSGLTEVILPDSLITIGDNAFDGCSSLRIINIPNSVQTINRSVFSHCENLQYNRYDNAFYLGNEENRYLCLVRARNATITSCEINNGCRFIFGGAFNSCSNLTSIEIPDKVLNIGNGAFYYCSSLKSVIFGKSIKYIEDYAFNYCTSIQMAIFPNSLESIGGYAFADCSSLKTVYIPNSVSFINGVNPSFCNSEAIIYCQDTTYGKWERGWYYKQLQGVTSPGHEVLLNCILKDSLIYQITSSEEPYTVKVCKYIGNSSSVEIPETVVSEDVEYVVTDIAENIFSDCASSITLIMKSQTVPNLSNINALQSVTSIHIPCGSLNNYKSAAYWGTFGNYTEDFSYVFSAQSDDEAKGTIEIKKEPTCSENAVIQANAETGYVFYQWSDGNKSNPRYITVTQDTALVAYFVVDEVEAEITSAGTAQGTVSNSSGTYHYNDEIEISATANYGYTFAMWSDGETANPRTVVLRKDTAIRAEFAVNQYAITLKTNIAERGSVSGDGSFNYLTNNKITATANYGYVFEKWGDGNTENPRTIALTRDTAFTAVFVPDEVSVAVVSADTVRGKVSALSGTHHYYDTITISATANYGYHFAHWSDSVTANPRTIVLRGDTAIQAQFAATQYSIAVGCNNAELGSVSGGGTFDYLATASISATANHGYAFKQWNDGNYDNPRRVTITQDTAFTAVFVPDEVNVEVVSADTARGKVSALSGTHHYYDTITISATANYGYHFATWSDSVTANPRTIVLRGDTVIQAQFAANQYTITIGCNNADLGSVSGGGTFDYLATAKISATANHGYAFKQWNDGNYDNPRRVTITQDAAFTAVFVPDEVSVEVKSADTEHGTVTELPGVYHFNEKIIISAIAVPHYHFVAWSDGNRQNPRELLLRGDTVLTAAFGIDTFSVAAKCDTAMGAVSGAGLYSYGSAAKVEAKPAAHHHFVQWTSGAVQTTQEFVVEHDTTFEAVFAIDRHSVALAASDSLCGAVSGAGSYDYGASVQLQATPAANCYFTGWSDGVTTNPRTLTVEGDTNIVAEFGKLQTVNIMVAANDTLRGTVAGTGSYVVGNNATLSATASAHYLFEQWSDGRTDNPRTVRAIADATYKAVFVPMQYNIILSQNNADMGMVSGSGVYSYGERVSCLAKPYPNYHFVQWSNGETANPYEFVVEEDKMLTAYFAAGAVTAIGNESAIEPTIYAIGKTIVVENATDEIRVYDAMGKLICRDAIHRVRAELRVNAAGVYIIKTGNVVMRVVVE